MRNIFARPRFPIRNKCRAERQKMLNDLEGRHRFKRPMGMAIAVVVTVAMLGGCASAPDYRPLGASGVGYTDQALSANRYMVAVSGSRAIPRDDVQRYLLRRAAEVTLRPGTRTSRSAPKTSTPRLTTISGATRSSMVLTMRAVRACGRNIRMCRRRATWRRRKSRC